MENIGNTLVNGEVKPGFESVKDIFIENFIKRNEIGAACSVYFKGEKVVDLWGGYSSIEESRKWDEKTLVLVFSATKGMSSLTLALAHSKGLFGYDDRVAQYWPEFGQNGKKTITIRQLLSHQAGLCVIAEKLTIDVLTNPNKLSEILAKQKPAWIPGEKHGYHAFSLGWYENELLKRIDPYGRDISKFFQEEIAKPLNLEFYIGLPNTIKESRIAKIYDFTPIQMAFHINNMPWKMTLSYFNPNSLTAKTMSNPQFKKPGDIGRKPFRNISIPAGNGIGQVRSIAKAYGEFAASGKTLGLSNETFEELSASASQPKNGSFDEVLKVNTSYSLGYMKPSFDFDFGSKKAFGDPGAGGAFAFADPEYELGFAYAPNKMGFHLWNDPREQLIRNQVYECIKNL